MKGSAVSKSSNVRGRGLSISIYYIILAICTSTLICIRPAGAPTSGLKGSAVFNNSVLQEILSTSRFHVLFSTTAMSFCLAGTPGVIAVVLVTLTASLQDLLYLCLRQQQQKQQKNRLVTSCTTGSLASWAQTPRDTSFAWVVVGGSRRRTFGQFNVSYSQNAANLNMGLHIFLVKITLSK
ncbi:hypothetical protein DPMN_189008 [Dreissena polymorpha]|uniref:Uncharacterized protein n=1 Tax=Dreissena polymorpha TaxID=45954 RepID=A0A9D4DRZ3_DREPO|nr:hypothetical protein DPMN_189008 [Dreissena polymorpha]